MVGEQGVPPLVRPTLELRVFAPPTGGLLTQLACLADVAVAVHRKMSEKMGGRLRFETQLRLSCRRRLLLLNLLWLRILRRVRRLSSLSGIFISCYWMRFIGYREAGHSKVLQRCRRRRSHDARR